MKANLFLLLIIIGLGFVYMYWADTPATTPHTIEAVSDFEYTDISGQKDTLYNHRGKPVLLHFWATWCAPCIVEMPALIDFAKKNDVVVLAISKDFQEQDIKPFLSKIKISVPGNVRFIWDQNNEISEHLFNIYKLPETIILAPDLTIQDKIIGPYDNWDQFRL